VGAQHRVALDPAIDRPAAADAGGVDQDHRLAVQLDGAVDRVARRPRHVADDHPLVAEHLVDEGRLAGVRPSHHRHPRRRHLNLLELRQLFLGELIPFEGRYLPLRALLGLVLRRQPLDDRIGQVARVPAVLCTDAHGRVEAESVELCGLRLAAVVIDLVDHQDDRLAGAPQPIGQLMVERRDARRHVDQEQDQVRLLDRNPRLDLHPLLDVAARLELEATGIDHGEVPAAPVGLAVGAVAGRARHVLDDHHALADEAVEERGLADVRTADDGDHGEGGHGWSVRCAPRCVIHHLGEMADKPRLSRDLPMG
jgi:hypothetical protein